MSLLNYFFKQKNTRPLLDAILDVKYQDCSGQLPVSIVRFTGSSALIHTDHIFLNNRHLIAFEEKPSLSLKMFLPEGNVEGDIHIRWYKYSIEHMVFEIFIEFESSIKKKKKIIHQAIKRIQKESRKTEY